MQPAFKSDDFNCPHCQVHAHQLWYGVVTKSWTTGGMAESDRVFLSQCQHCREYAVWWRDKTMVYPFSSTAPHPIADMPEDVKADFEEARKVFQLSAKSAAALLRLALQKLLKQLGEKGKNIDDDIAALVKKGLPVQVQQSLDIVRVIGNEAVHPGVIDFDDNPETAAALFTLLNIIVERMITQPKQINELYSALPKGKLDAIAKRDGK